MYTNRSVKANHENKLRIPMGSDRQVTKSRREWELRYQPQRLTLQATSCHFNIKVCPDKNKHKMFSRGEMGKDWREVMNRVLRRDKKISYYKRQQREEESEWSHGLAWTFGMSWKCQEYSPSSRCPLREPAKSIGSRGQSAAPRLWSV